MNEELLDRAESSFGQWQQDIIFVAKNYSRRRDKGEPIRAEIRQRQEALEAAVRSGPGPLGQHLREQIGLEESTSIGAPVFPRGALTPGEYLNPPIPLEAELGEAWADAISPSWASRPAFWLLCHIEWIEQGRLGFHDLAEVLLSAPSRPDMDRRIRNLLRRTGGIPHVRGKVSVFSDCTLARAWWRHRLSHEIASVTDRGVSAASAHKVLHANRPAWERLIMLSLRRLTVINHPRARAAIVRELEQRLHMFGSIDQHQVKTMAVTVARLGLRHSLDHLRDDALAHAVARA